MALKGWANQLNSSPYSDVLMLADLVAMCHLLQRSLLKGSQFLAQKGLEELSVEAVAERQQAWSQWMQWQPLDVEALTELMVDHQQGLMGGLLNRMTARDSLLAEFGGREEQEGDDLAVPQSGG